MEIRKTAIEELDTVMELYAAARAFMVDTGNPRQWAARNWPPRALIAQDIAQGKSYVCEAEGTLLAVFFYDYGYRVDPCYDVIEDGEWRNDEPYGVVHRIAAKAGSGAGKACINWAFAQCGHLRIDTHGDNQVMQRTLRKLGFEKRGIIHVKEDSDPRIAFEKC
ncbi:MAG: GNAT family N-acetyltransferase [Oscillospiraceae bacterium]|nr:GNAT family N-acetyltransferase [Oscillospiraceae bacterium]